MQREPRVVTTCPESSSIEPSRYLETVIERARQSEDAGHHGLLIHSDHRLLDPWVIAQVVLAATRRLRPVVTVQPLYLHPYAAARKIASLVAMFGRPADLVLAAGGFRTDLLALDERASHRARYDRVVEYGRIVSRLLSSSEPITHDGEAYRIHQPRGLAPLQRSDRPQLFVAASSRAGRTAARGLGATGVLPLLPDAAFETGDGVRVGILAREDADEALRVAAERFPERSGPHLEHRLEMKWTDSRWQQHLIRAAEDAPAPWWLAPFEHRHAQTPYLVGDIRTVSRALVPALEAGCEWLFLDAPGDPDDLEHSHQVLRRAWNRASSRLALTTPPAACSGGRAAG